MERDELLMREAAQEVRNLRRTNELLTAQVRVIAVFEAALIGRPSQGGMAPDIAWALDLRADEICKERSNGHS